jgi:hypothetical protein
MIYSLYQNERINLMIKSYPTLDKLEQIMATSRGKWYITAPNREGYKTLSILWENTSSNITDAASERSLLLAALIITNSEDAPVQPLAIEDPNLDIRNIMKDTHIYIIPNDRSDNELDDDDLNYKLNVSIFCDQNRQADHPYLVVLRKLLTVISEQELNDYLEKTFDNVIYGESIFNYCGVINETFTFGQLD